MTDVSTISPAIERQRQRIELVRALRAGTRGMRDAGERFLPRMPAESSVAYTRRLEGSTLFNGVGKTIATLAGKVFRRAPELGADVPASIVAMCEDIDRDGTRFDVFARDLLESALTDGLVHVLVDHPKQPPGRTLADERAAKVRPYCVKVDQGQVLGFRTKRANGVTVLTQLRYIAPATIEDGDYGEREVDEIRVLEPGKFEIWRQGQDSGAWELIEIGETSLDYIPFVSIYAGRRIGHFEAEPPLSDLADLNAAHWRSSSDQTNILHVARVPVLFGAGWSQEDADEQFGDILELGPNRLIVGPKDATLQFVEHSGAAISAGRQDIEDLEARMSVAGMELLVRRPGNATATGRAIDASEADSALASMAAALEDGLEAALGLMARWLNMGDDAGGSVTVNKEFGISQRDARELDGLYKLHALGALRTETLLRELHRRGILADDIDIEAEAEAADAEPPPADDIRDAVE